MTEQNVDRKLVTAISRIPISKELFLSIAEHLNLPVFELKNEGEESYAFQCNKFSFTLRIFPDAETADILLHDYVMNMTENTFVRNPRWFVGHGYIAHACQTQDMTIHYVSLVRNTVIEVLTNAENIDRVMAAMSSIGYA